MFNVTLTWLGTREPLIRGLWTILLFGVPLTLPEASATLITDLGNVVIPTYRIRIYFRARTYALGPLYTAIIASADTVPTRL